tara:strand:- start:1032 stop:1241 length:210 start_codon:yes stop_codon:yes gene_type:complete
MKMNVGKGRVRGENVDMETAESKLVPNTVQGSANELTVAQRKLDMNNDGTLTGIDFKMLGNKNKKKGMA